MLSADELEMKGKFEDTVYLWTRIHLTLNGLIFKKAIVYIKFSTINFRKLVSQRTKGKGPDEILLSDG